MTSNSWKEKEHAYLKALTDRPGRKTWKKWAEEMSVVFKKPFNAEQLRSYWRMYIRDTKTSVTPSYKEEVEILGNGSVKSDKLIELSLEQAKDPQYILEAHGFDPNEWEVINAKSSQWLQHNKKDGTVNLYSSQITVRPVKDELTAQKLIDSFAEEVKPYEQQSIKRGHTNLVIPLADLHWGVTKFRHAEEKLNEILFVISKGYKTIVIEQLGDLFHSSQMKSSQTLKGTMLDDVDMVQAIEDAKKFYHAIVTEALKHADEVRVEHAAGNHSGNMEYMFLVYLEAKYPQLKVNLHNDFRKAYLLDEVGILISHGDTAQKKLPILFAFEYKDIWSKAKTMEVHTGHYHTQEKDLDGVLLRQMGTVKPNDLYEIEHGWTTGKKVIQLIEYASDRAKVLYEI